jgi:3-carboxy-cis,cis-muconate cycloisomerase
MAIGTFDSFITRGWFDAGAMAVWDERATLQAWLDVEAALAEAEADLGLVPADSARIIAAEARADRFDLDRLSADISHAQHPFIPVLKQFEELCGEPAAGYIHLGATTQNIFDTAVSLQMQQTHGLLVARIDEALAHLRDLAGRHAGTVMAGRTHGQHALPMTFGFKLAGWIDELARDRDRLADRCAGSFVACLGGAIGTGASLGDRAPEVERRLAARLGLRPAGLAMRGSYDRMADYLLALGLLAGTIEKIAGDIVFLQRTEIAELSEAFHYGKVGSSTMPQKRNPSTALRLISLCRMQRARMPLVLEAMVRMDEGDSSATNVTDATVPEVAVLAVSAAATLAGLAAGLVANPEAMARNLALTDGLIVAEALMVALSPTIGRHAAHHLLYDVAQSSLTTGNSFAQEIHAHSTMKAVPPEQIAVLLDTSNYIGRSVAIATEASKTPCAAGRPGSEKSPT